MYTAILAKIPVLLAGLLLVAAVIIIYFRSKNTTRAEFVRIFKSARVFGSWIIILCILFTSIFGIFNHLNLRHSVGAIVSLNYSEASRAQNSNGTRYNMAEIICDEVVERAIKKGALPDVTVKQLKECLAVYPSVQGSVADESEYHISTEFAVDYYASKHTAHLNAENVIQLICNAYKEYYIEKYTDNFRLDSLSSEEELKNLEYMDVVSYFNKETSEILNYLYGMAEKGPSFVTSNNTTFSSIAGKVYQFQQTQIEENLKSLILQNGIARDKGNYIDRLSYQNKNTSFDKQKNAVSFNLCNQAIARYSEEMTRIVLVPTWDQSGKYYMGRTKVGIDELSVQATAFSDKVASNEKQIMDNNLIIGKMSAGGSSPAATQAVDELIESIYGSIKKFEKEAITAGREYSSHTMNQCIAVSIYGASLMQELKSIVFFAVLAYAALLLFDIAKKFPKRA
ncbi:MAG: hypothetical protein IIV97_03085 [Oscillospiraceae bacterium]|nr:hypothetical protein [Oscillospiraceae bacterium]